MEGGESESEWGGGGETKTAKRHNQSNHFHPTKKENREYGVFPETCVCFGHFLENHWLYLRNRDSSFKENRVSEDGDKKEGFETIL